jgi:hypothetical protein
VRFLAVSQGFPLRAPSDSRRSRRLQVEGARALNLWASPTIEIDRGHAYVVASATEPYPILKRLVEAIASFGGEIGPCG